MLPTHRCPECGTLYYKAGKNSFIAYEGKCCVCLSSHVPLSEDEFKEYFQSKIDEKPKEEQKLYALVLQQELIQDLEEEIVRLWSQNMDHFSVQSFLFGGVIFSLIWGLGWYLS